MLVAFHQEICTTKNLPFESIGKILRYVDKPNKNHSSLQSLIGLQCIQIAIALTHTLMSSDFGNKLQKQQKAFQN